MTLLLVSPDGKTQTRSKDDDQCRGIWSTVSCMCLGKLQLDTKMGMQILKCNQCSSWWCISMNLSSRPIKIPPYEPPKPHLERVIAHIVKERPKPKFTLVHPSIFHDITKYEEESTKDHE